MFSLQISSLPLEQPSADNKEVRPSSLCARILQKFWKKDQTQNSQQINESSKFLETKLFQDVTNDTTVKLEQDAQEIDAANSIPTSIKECSILDLIQFSKGKIEQKVFLINDTNQSLAKRYVHIKCTKFQQKNKEKYMLQIIDVSHGIMYDQQKAENSFLALINACVSHELRNPLNSIIA